MPSRTPSFIVVGLVIIMFLLGLFYMSCSSKNTELRLSLEQFEERIRSLTLKNSDSEKRYDNLNTRKRELEEEKLNIQRQMEKKDSEINDLNTKLNEKLNELKSLNTDKKVLDEQLKDQKSLSEDIASKNLLIEKLQQQINDKKQSNTDELTRLKREYEALRNNSSPSNTEPKNTFVIPPQRFRPIETNNLTTKSIASLFQDPLNKLNNLTKEIKAEFAPAVEDIKDKVLNAFGLNTNLSTSTIGNQQLDLNNEKQQQQEVGQNVPAPPLANNAQRQQQANHVESAQAAPQLVGNNQAAAAENLQYQNKLQGSLQNSLSENRNEKLSDLNEKDDEEEEELNDDNAEENRNPVRENNNQLVEDPSAVRSNRKANRERFRKRGNRNRQEQQLDNGGELDANEDDQQRRKRNVL